MNKNSESKIKTAIDFLKESNLFKADRYNLLKPLMRKVLNDTVCNEDIEEFVDSIAPLDEESESKEENLTEEKEVKKRTEISIHKEDLRIKSIREIKSIENVGLIDKIESIKLNPKINIFYGLNASGKSSLYKPICNALGYEKETLANINEDASLIISKCCLEVEDRKGKIHEIEWQNGETKPKLNVKIFDPDISLSLIKDDQDNTFSLAYLEQEYFPLLSEFLEKLEDRLKKRKGNYVLKFDFLKKNLQSKLPFLFEEEEELKEENIKYIKITEEEKNTLESSIKEYEELQKINFGDKIQILNNLIEQIEDILRTLGERTEVIENKYVWKNIFKHEYFREINSLIKDYLTYKKILEGKQSIHLKDVVPESWLKNDAWGKFIDSSFDFIKSLSEAEQKKYLEEECPYCHQELLEKAKRLMEGYRILQGEIKEKLSRVDESLGDYLGKIDKTIEGLEGISQKEKAIDEGAKEFLAAFKKTCDKNYILNLLAKLKNTILNKNELKYSQEDVESIEGFFKYYLFIRHKFLQKEEEYKEKNKNKEENLEKLEVKIQPLKIKAEIVNNEKDLLKYMKLCNISRKIDDILSLIVDTKAYVSRLSTEFNNEVYIGEFQKYLDKEYENLNFVKPLKYQLTTRTAYGENKRVYRMGDKKIKEIFSEGEQKQHALADFFAQSEIENFEGVFILDDPVTSLDECNMEYLSERIVRLAQERDNQTIILTHNLVFLNYLLELTGEEKVKHFTRVSTEIFLDPNAKLGTEHDLKVKRNEINKRVKMLNEKEINGNKINEYEIRNIYDLLSGYLESFVEVKIFKSVIGRYRPNIRMKNLNEIEWDNGLINEVMRLFNKTSRKGSRHSQPIGIQTPKFPELIKDKENVDNLVLRIR